MSSSQAARDRWIEDTQMFQRIAGVVVSSTVELSQEWDKMNRPRRERETKRAAEHRILQDAAIRCGKRSGGFES